MSFPSYCQKDLIFSWGVSSRKNCHNFLAMPLDYDKEPGFEVLALPFFTLWRSRLFHVTECDNFTTTEDGIYQVTVRTFVKVPSTLASIPIFAILALFFFLNTLHWH